MTLDVVALRAFYATPLGETARRFVGRALAGFPVARVRRQRDGARLFPARISTPCAAGPSGCSPSCRRRRASSGWPADGRSAACLADSLYAAAARRLASTASCWSTRWSPHEDPDELFYEIWRVLAPERAARGGGAQPRRPSGAAHGAGQRPFGHGQPYSRGQLKALMRRTLVHARDLDRRRS